MRLQLTVLVLVVLVAGSARADGTLEARTVYYKEYSTRVIQPMVDGQFEIGARGLLDAHVLVDAVTSASAGAGGTAVSPQFSKNRYEGGVGYTHEYDGPAGTLLDAFRLHGEGRISHEPDYRSLYAGGRIEGDLFQKNVTAALGAWIMEDTRDVSSRQSALGGLQLQCPSDTAATSNACNLTSSSVYGSASQIISRNAVVGASYELDYLDGYQSNPYRTVVTAGGLVAEKHPFTRLRQAIGVQGRLYIPETETTLIGSYGFYHDDWKINAHTPQLRVVQQVGLSADASFAYRYYTQTRAFFEQAKYPDPAVMPLSYYTYDPKMTAFDSHLFEAKLGVYGREFGLTGKWAGTRFEGLLEYIVQNNRFHNAGVAHVSVTIPFDY
jgi:hypothetical protein